MDEESELGSPSDEGSIPACVSQQERTMNPTSNGHSYSLSSGATEKKVDPLKIRIGRMHVAYRGTSKQQSISHRIKQIKEQHSQEKLSPNEKQKTAAWKSTKNVIQKTTANISTKTSIRGSSTVKKSKPEKSGQIKEYAQSLGLQPTVKFKCRKCSSMSFKSLFMLKEHQRMCKSQTGIGDDESNVANDGASGRVTKKVYLCSSCSTYYENWNLFLHMREIHNRHICLHCLGMFSKAERLTSHLNIKHGISEQIFNDKETLQAHYDGALFLICCTCDQLYTEKDNYLLHICDRVVSTAKQFNDKMCITPCNENPEFENALKNEPVLSPTVENNTSDELPSEESTNLSKEENSHPIFSQSYSDTSSKYESTNNQSSDNLNTCVSESSDPAVTIKNNQDHVPEIDNNNSTTAANNCVNEDYDSVSSEGIDDIATVCIDSSKNENNNITCDKEREVGIKLKLSLNNSSSPVIINSTIKPDQEPKPLVRPNRPPGGRIVALDEPIPLPAVNSVLSTIYDNKTEDVCTINRVPKLTVRVPKGLLDKESSSGESSDTDSSDKLTVDDTQSAECIEKSSEEIKISSPLPIVNQDIPETNINNSITPLPLTEEVATTELTLNKPLDKYPLKELVKVFLAGTMYYCVFCNHARKIAVNCKQLALHMLDAHRFSATVESITAEELLPETIRQRVLYGLKEIQNIFINLDTYDSVDPCELLPYVRTYECFQCYFTTTVHKDLYLHNRKMHQKTILLCVMCKSNFYSYSELLCHLCPGTYDPDYEIKFRCCMCNMDNIPSSFRLMVHLRKVHHACDVCTEVCDSQSRLSMHVWKHKLHHLCYRCGIAYRNKADITKHLFWKHGTESVLCKKCLQKKWPHVYHFCIPPALFTCDECNNNFSKAVFLKVHKRFHSETYPYPCTEKECEQKFVSKKLLAKHVQNHQESKSEDSAGIEEKTIKIENKDEPKQTPKDNVKEETITEVTEITKYESESLTKFTKSKKKKNKDKDNFLLDVNLPALNLSESDSSEESDTNLAKFDEDGSKPQIEEIYDEDKIQLSDLLPETKVEEKDCDQQALDIWDNFKQYQAKVEKPKPKSPPLKLIRRHVCESDHDYCLVPNEMNGESLTIDSLVKRHKRKSPKKKYNKNNTESSSSSSSSSSSDSCCSRGSKCSCSSSSNSSSSSSTDSDSSSSLREYKQKKDSFKRRDSNGSHSSAVDVMALEEQIPLIPEKKSSPIPETDLETEETDTDEEFYDKHPQCLANKLHAEKRNQLMLLASVAPSDNFSVTEDLKDPEKPRSQKRKRKTKKRKKGLKNKQEHIKLNIPKDVMEQSGKSPTTTPNPNKIKISLHSNTVHIQNTSTSSPSLSANTDKESKRASKRRRVPNKFYGYSSDEELTNKPQHFRNDWKKEELSLLASAAKSQPSISHKVSNYNEPLVRMSTPVPDPVPPPILMNTESMESSDSGTSDEYELRIDHSNEKNNATMSAPPSYAMASGSNSLAIHFPKPAGVRQAREGESVYCYCRCPYDEVSEMIACDAIGCAIEWFHFECVGIMVPPKGKWYCPDCRQRQGFI